MLLRFTGFGGANKALHPLLLPDGIGVDSLNQRPGRGDLRPWNAPSNVATAVASAQTIYRMGRSTPSDSTYWLSWAADVDVARGFIATDTAERTFWTGDGVPKWTDNTIGLGAPPYPSAAGVRLLGVPAPSSAPTLTQQVAGTGDDETRIYVVVWRNDRGEFSAPSAEVAITCKPGATIRITRNASVPSGNYGITHWQVYRTVAGNDADYFFVGEYTAATAFADTVDTNINSQLTLLSEDWMMPRTNLRGLKALWNGIMVGFEGKVLCFSEPFRPFAWPTRYELILDDDIVALGRWRQQLVVVTVNQPYLVTGSSPAAMTVQMVETNQACVAKKSLVEFGHGVAWAAPDGIAYLGEGGARVLTKEIALRVDWQALVPSSIVACDLDGMYLASYNDGGGRRSIMVDPRKADGWYFSSVGFSAAHRDPIADQVYLLNGTNIQKWDAGSALSASARSKVMRVSKPTSFTFGQVVADAYPVTLSMWANGTQRLTNYSVTGPRPFRLPAGFLADEWQVEVTTTGAAVQLVALAQSSAELRES
jgi:hypothetical protein